MPPAVPPGAGSEEEAAPHGAARDRLRDAAPSTRPAAEAATRESDAWDAVARRPRVRLVVLAAALAFFVLNAVVIARTDTPTVDEFVYVPAGYWHVTTGDLSFDPTNPPLLKMLMALPLASMDLRVDPDPRHRDNRTGWGPWIFGTHFQRANPDRYLDAFFAARLVVVALGVALGALLYRRASELLGSVAALAVAVLFATSSPVLAHSALATLDIGVSLLLLATLVAADRFATTRSLAAAAATGALFGLAFCGKGTAALFGPLVPVLIALRWKGWDRRGVQGYVTGGIVMAAAAWIAVLACYGFRWFPLPVPLVEGVRFQMAASSAGEFPAFLAGQWSQTGWWYYYLAALAWKTAIPTLVLAACGVVAMVRRPLPGRADLWIALPPLLLLDVLSFHYAKDYGIRYLLPAFPFLLLAAGRGVDLLLAAGPRARQACAALLAWQVAACAIAAPHHLAYFNEIGGGPDRARRLLLDSNLDWGQDLGRLADYLDSRGIDRIGLGYFGHVDPSVEGIRWTMAPAVPAPGLYAVSANFLAGYPYAITYDGDRIRGVKAGTWSWLDRLSPIARAGSSIYVFDVSADDVARLNAAPAR